MDDDGSTEADVVEEVVESVPESEEMIGILSNSEVARQVIAGQWSRGHRRNARLVAAGYNPVEVSNEVFKILNP